MKCPYCGSKELRVTDSRDAPEGNAIRRRRECLHCSRRFTTFETVELALQVHKRDGRYEEFQEQKLMNGLKAACRHTRISHEQILSIVEEITSLLQQRQTLTVSSRELGEIAMSYLQACDPIAYIRFACVYKRFGELKDFEEAIRDIQPKASPSHSPVPPEIP